jgi:hypothetical protein
MTDILVKAGEWCPLIWVCDDAFDDPPTLTIINTSDDTVVSQSLSINDSGDGEYFTVWPTSSSQDAGVYSATLSGKVLGVSVNASVLVFVSSSNSYVDLALFKLDRGITTTDFDELISQYLAAASWAIDRECGRTFARLPSSARMYPTDGNTYTSHQSGISTLFVDDIATPDGSVVIEYGDGWSWTTLPSTEYRVQVSDVQVSQPPGERVTLRPGSDWRSLGPQVRVTAEWGWLEPPLGVVQAAHMQAARLWSRRGSPEGSAGVAEWGLSRVRVEPDVRALLVGLRRESLA